MPVQASSHSQDLDLDLDAGLQAAVTETLGLRVQSMHPGMASRMHQSQEVWRGHVSGVDT